MIKGINRQVVEVRETGSDYFERILFFVKPEYAAVSEGKIRERAGMIADKTARPPVTKVRKEKYTEVIRLLFCLFSGILIGALAVWFLK
ncbi:MAG: hypothetical protein IKJ27_03385 [Clostridia bacterium]|nr:hypothetical protein [Clostridia bacterium]